MHDPAVSAEHLRSVVADSDQYRQPPQQPREQRVLASGYPGPAADADYKLQSSEKHGELDLKT